MKRFETKYVYSLLSVKRILIFFSIISLVELNTYKKICKCFPGHTFQFICSLKDGCVVKYFAKITLHSRWRLLKRSVTRDQQSELSMQDQPDDASVCEIAAQMSTFTSLSSSGLFMEPFLLKLLRAAVCRLYLSQLYCVVVLRL